jgi:hypothetical protein
MLPMSDIQLILQVLAERPLRESMNTFLRITQQVAPQQQLPQGQPAEVPPAPPQPNGAEAHD